MSIISIAGIATNGLLDVDVTKDVDVSCMTMSDVFGVSREVYPEISPYSIRLVFGIERVYFETTEEHEPMEEAEIARLVDQFLGEKISLPFASFQCLGHLQQFIKKAWPETALEEIKFPMPLEFI